MGSEREFKPIEYDCPICGERTTFGTHFCKGDAKAAPGPRAPRLPAIPWKTIGAAIVALLMIEVFLWEMVGVLSLYAMAAVPIIALLVFGLRRLPFFRASADYKSLVKLSGGDEAAAERQIYMETLRHPGLSRKEHIAALLEQWKRDLR
jgi:hypothetical protein